MAIEETTEGKSIIARRPGRLLLAGLALGFAFDLLFDGKMLGISVPIFALLLLAGLALALRWEMATLRSVNGANLWLPAGLLFFAVMSFVRASGFLLFLNISAGLVLTALIAVYITRRPVVWLSLPALLIAPVEAVASSLLHAWQITAHVGRHDLAAVARPNRSHVLPILRGLLIAAPVLFVFTILLASADLIFADRLHHLLSPEFFKDLYRWMGHAWVILIVGFLLAGGLAYAVRQRAAGWADRLAAVSAAGLPRFPAVTEAAVVLNSVNALFFLFVLIQVPYLFGGRLNIDPAKFTYAQYARRGFGELVIVAILTLGLILFLGALASRNSSRRRLVFNLSATILLGLTGVMLASAFKRLLLYEMAYGFTQLRIYPHVFMVWLGILLAWFAVTLWLKPGRDLFAAGVLVAALGFVATLDLLNPDALIVRQNFRRFQEMGAEQARAGDWWRDIDAYYFARLSEDAVPALIAVAGQSTGQVRDIIEEGLRRRAEAMRCDTDWRRWQSFHLSRSRAYRLLIDRYGGETGEPVSSRP
ncbi:MAG: DUF4173 domain-containing protein [Anaerolineae bacterium]|nr:DUF4173 domain-containing protein [Anaerolineae bacterium]